MSLKIIVTVASIVVLCMANTIFASPQQITFFEDFGCSGKNESTTITRDDLSTSWITNSSSFLIVGLWKYTARRNDGRQSVTVTHYNTKPPNGRCVDKSSWEVPDWQNYTLYYASRVGGENLESSEVAFFTEKNFSGLKYTVKNDTAKVAPRPFAMLSYVHFSNETWTVYPEEDFRGTPTHLYPSSEIVNGTVIVPVDNFTFNSSSVLIVGSIKKGEIVL